MRNIKQYLPAGERVQVGAVGNFFFMKESAAAVLVEFIDIHGNVRTAEDVESGAWFELREFVAVALTSATAQSVQFLVAAEGRAGVFRVAGEVSVISGELTRTKAGNAFWGNGLEAASAGNYSAVQLWNPPANTKRLVVTQMMTSNVGVAYSVGVGINQVALTTLSKTAKNKYFSQPDSLAEIRTGVTVTAMGGGGTFNVTKHIAYDTNVGSTNIELREPIVIPPGYGLVLQGEAVNVGVRGMFQLYEEAI